MSLVRISILGSVLLSASVGSAQSYTPPGSDPQARELHKLGKEKRSSIASALGKKFKTGHAEIFIDAPVSQVRASVLDYPNYQIVIPAFQKAKVLKKSGAAADVYLQIPIMNGAAMVWTVQHFDAPTTKGKLEWIDGTSLKGNVDALRTRLTYRAVDATHTVLSADIYVEPHLPGIPVPGSTIAHEAENAASEAVVAVKAHAEAAAKKVVGAKP